MSSTEITVEKLFIDALTKGDIEKAKKIFQDHQESITDVQFYSILDAAHKAWAEKAQGTDDATQKQLDGLFEQIRKSRSPQERTSDDKGKEELYAPPAETDTTASGAIQPSAGASPATLSQGDGDAEILAKLQSACQDGRVDAIQALLPRAGNEIDKNSLLMLACKNGKPAAVTYLIDQGADVDALDKTEGITFGWTPLMIASHRGDLPLVNAILAKNPNLKLKTPRDPQMLINDGDQWRMKTRREARLDDRFMAIHLACEQGHADVVKAMMAQIGVANIDTYRTALQYTPLQVATMYRQDQVAAVIPPALITEEAIALEDAEPAFLAACLRGDEETVHHLLAQCRELKSQEQLTRGLKAVCEAGHLGIVRVLLHAQPNIPLDGLLVIACNNQRTNVAIELIHRGANINEVGPQGNTPLLYACEHRDTALLRAILSKAENLNATQNAVRLILGRAGEPANVDFINLLFGSQNFTPAQRNQLFDSACSAISEVAGQRTEVAYDEVPVNEQINQAITLLLINGVGEEVIEKGKQTLGVNLRIITDARMKVAGPAAVPAHRR